MDVFLLGVGGVGGSDCGSDADWEKRRESKRPRVAADFVDGDCSFGDGVRVDATNLAGEYVWPGVNVIVVSEVMPSGKVSE